MYLLSNASFSQNEYYILLSIFTEERLIYKKKTLHFSTIFGSDSVCHVYLVSWEYITFYVLTKGYTVPGNQGTHEKLNQIPIFKDDF